MRVRKSNYKIWLYRGAMNVNRLKIVINSFLQMFSRINNKLLPKPHKSIRLAKIRNRKNICTIDTVRNYLISAKILESLNYFGLIDQNLEQ